MRIPSIFFPLLSRLAAAFLLQCLPPQSVLGDGFSVPRYHALIIGINNYHQWPTLVKPRSDAERVEKILRQDYGFDHVQTVYDGKATRSHILNTLRNLSRTLGKDDSLLIYYAGHGYYDTLLETGSWIPVDARVQVEGDLATGDWLSNDTLKKYLSVMKARQVLVVSDACFSGSLFRGGDSLIADRENAYYQRAIALPARWGLSSGDLESVPDDSVFARKFVQLLQYPERPVFAASDLAGWMKREVARDGYTLPRFGPLRDPSGLSGGEFVFLHRTARIQRITPAGEAPPAAGPTPEASAPPVAYRPLPNDLTPVADATFADHPDHPAVQSQQGAVRRGGLPLEVRNRTGLVFRLLPPGRFGMGSEHSDPARRYDELPHQVEIGRPLYFAKFEVTREQWRQVMGSDPSSLAQSGDQAPVESLTWDEAQAFVQKLSEREGVDPGTYRLPTEAEWEYACRAGGSIAFTWGNDYREGMANVENAADAQEHAQVDAFRKRGLAVSSTLPVGGFPPNPWGLHDLAGNVWEWVADYYGNYPATPTTDPAGPEHGRDRVLRGGAWNFSAASVRCANRYRNLPQIRRNSIGIRVVRAAP